MPRAPADRHDECRHHVLARRAGGARAAARAARRAGGPQCSGRATCGCADRGLFAARVLGADFSGVRLHTDDHAGPVGGGRSGRTPTASAGTSSSGPGATGRTPAPAQSCSRTSSCTRAQSPAVQPRRFSASASNRARRAGGRRRRCRAAANARSRQRQAATRRCIAASTTPRPRSCRTVAGSSGRRRAGIRSHAVRVAPGRNGPEPNA